MSPKVARLVADEGLAVDLLDDDAPLKPPTAYVLRLAAAAQGLKLSTGARWELPKRLGEAIDDAIARQDWDAKVKVGWDPLHVEPSDITVAETRPPLRRRPT